MHDYFSIKIFSDARAYFSCPFDAGWSLMVVEYEAHQPIYSDARLDLRHSAIQFVRTGNGAMGENANLFFVIAERFEGVGARSRYMRRSIELSEIDLGIVRIVKQQKEVGAIICYCVPANSGWLEKSLKAKAAIGLICFEADVPGEVDLYWMMENIFSNQIRLFNLLEAGMPAAYAESLVGRCLFTFYGECDDTWSSLLVFRSKCSSII